ncbi:MAG: OmpA family protein, partial [Myxococcales bacterium]
MSALVVGARPAWAEPATALDRLQPAPAGDAFVAVPAAVIADGVRPAGAVLVSWARDPLRLQSRRGDGSSTQRQVVSDQVIAHALVSLEVRRRLLLEADLPVALVQRGEGVTAPSGALA